MTTGIRDGTCASDEAGRRAFRAILGRLFPPAVLSAGLFYLEMTVIRLVSAEIRIFAYFKNLALIACFFAWGWGACPGCLRRVPFSFTYPLLASWCWRWSPQTPWVDPYARVTGSWHLQRNGGVGHRPPADGPAVEGGIARAPDLLVAWIALLFLPGGRKLAELFTRCPDRLGAYSVNILGSLAVSRCSPATSLLAPPIAWVAGAFLLGAPLLAGRREWITAGMSALVLAGGWLASPRSRAWCAGRPTRSSPWGA